MSFEYYDNLHNFDPFIYIDTNKNVSSSYISYGGNKNVSSSSYVSYGGKNEVNINDFEKIQKKLLKLVKKLSTSIIF